MTKNDEVQVKIPPGATADDIIDYIKPTVCEKPDIGIIQSGTNDLTKDLNTMSRVWKVVAAVEEIDTEGKTKLGFSGIIATCDINKEKDNKHLRCSLRNCNGEYESWEQNFIKVLKTHYNKNLRKTVLKRSSLKKKANRPNDPVDIANYKENAA